MSKVSSEFGRRIRQILDDKSLTFRAAGLQTSISAAYWKDMADGRVPSQEIIERIAEAMPDVDENELLTAAGYSPKIAEMDAVQAVEFALRGQKTIPEEGKRQILEFVEEMQEKYGGEGQ